MTRQELAKFMADLVGLHEVERFDIESYFYSPEGFFAVWDAFDTLRSDGIQNWWFWKEVFMDIYIHRKSRYEAFYNAIYGVMKDDYKSGS